MRLRNNPKAKDIIAEHNDIVLDIEKEFNREEVFGNDHPVFIEIGMGKGDFIIQNAIRYPENNYIGIEKYDSVLAVALNKLDSMKEKLPNLRLMRFDADDLLDYFPQSSVDKIYLNFSDPWPKNRHDKRRLTHSNYLKRYEQILKLPGQLEFKTDNRGLFEFSIISFNNFNLAFDQISLDLHHSEYMEDNIMTEYERKFSPKGPIYKIIVTFKG